MKVRLYNIQGFRGDYSYEIENPITIINSKHNGVGKTTLYDCLRFLCDMTSVDKEEQKYFLNLNEQEALFSVTVGDYTYGFALQKNSPPRFFRNIEGEVEVSDTNFNTVSQDIGVLIMNGAILNIFSKELNLFSSSNSKADYAMIKELTTHEPTEQVLELIRQSIAINRTELSDMRLNKKALTSQLEIMPHYAMVDHLEELLNNPFYEEFEKVVTVAKEYASKLEPVQPLNFNSDAENIFMLTDLVDQLIPKYDFQVDAGILETLEECNVHLANLTPTEIPVMDTNLLEQSVIIKDLCVQLLPAVPEFEYDLSLLEELEQLSNMINSLEPVENITVDIGLINHLAESAIATGMILTNLRQEQQAETKLAELRKSVENVRVTCPIREEVYLIDGTCCY